MIHMQHFQQLRNYIYRYNLNGFVEELVRLPESRYGHACAALPSTGVGCKTVFGRDSLTPSAQFQYLTCRHSLWLEVKTMAPRLGEASLLCCHSLLKRELLGPPLTPFLGHWHLFEAQLWEIWMNGFFGWWGATMMAPGMR